MNDSQVRKPWTQKMEAFFKNTAIVLGLTGKWAYKLRSLVMAIPVFVCALALAIRNLALLPEWVGVNMLATGEYQWLVSRGAAVMIPFGLTIACLVLVLCSKKTLYPWLISIFSLVLPMVIWITNSLLI